MAAIPALLVEAISRPGALLQTSSNFHFVATSFSLQPLFNEGLRLKIEQVDN